MDTALIKGFSKFVKSSWIRQLSYSPKDNRLRLQTKTGGVYDYTMPSDQFPSAADVLAISRSKSPGRAYNDFIKGRYDVTKVRAPRVSSQ